MLEYCQLDSRKQISLEFESKYNNVYTRKWIWKCQNILFRPQYVKSSLLACLVVVPQAVQKLPKNPGNTCRKTYSFREVAIHCLHFLNPTHENYFVLERVAYFRKKDIQKLYPSILFMEFQHTTIIMGRLEKYVCLANKTIRSLRQCGLSGPGTTANLVASGSAAFIWKLRCHWLRELQQFLSWGHTQTFSWYGIVFNEMLMWWWVENKHHMMLIFIGIIYIYKKKLWSQIKSFMNTSLALFNEIIVRAPKIDWHIMRPYHHDQVIIISGQTEILLGTGSQIFMLQWNMIFKNWF